MNEEGYIIHRLTGAAYILTHPKEYSDEEWKETMMSSLRGDHGFFPQQMVVAMAEEVGVQIPRDLMPGSGESLEEVRTAPMICIPEDPCDECKENVAHHFLNYALCDCRTCLSAEASWRKDLYRPLAGHENLCAC